MGTLKQDFRYGLRMLRKSRGFTAVAVITLALAIGANTAIFSVLYPAVLRPLPYRQPDRLVTLGEGRAQSPCCSYTSSYPDYQDWKQSAKSFVALAGFANDSFILTGNGDPKTIYAAMVTPNFFSTLGVNLLLGRDLVAEDLHEGASPPVVILRYDFWQSDFGGDPHVIGRTIHLDSRPVTVVGILPRNFEFGPAGTAQLWVPIYTSAFTNHARNLRWLDVIGRLAPGVSVDRARSEMDALTGQLAREYAREDGFISVTVGSLRDEVVGNVQPLLFILFGAVSFVLLIACANVANLLMTRSIDRRREFAVRTALGASRFHLLAQLLTESLMLSTLGAILGVLGAVVGVRLLIGVIPETQLQAMPFLADAGINFPVLGFVCGMTVLTALVFGLGPGFAVSQTSVSEVLKDESRGGTSGAHARLRNAVVIGELAISMVLLIGGGLMLQSLHKVLQQDPGFSAQNVLTFAVSLPGVSYPKMTVWPFANRSALRFEHEFVDRLRNVPGVQGASAVSGLPAIGNRLRNRFVVEGRPTPEGQEDACISRRVGIDYFAVMKIPLLAGRVFSEADGIDAPPVVIVNQTWVKRYGGGQDPLGQRLQLTFAPSEPFRQIVGVVGDVAEDSLITPPAPAMYLPLDQDSGFAIFLGYVVRSQQDPSALVSSARTILRGMDPQLALVDPRPMEQIVNESPAVFLRRYPFYLIGSFATLALILSMIGLYGLISYSVVGRTREIGIRLALGAERKDILRLVLRQGVITTLIGVGIGLIAGLVSMKVIASLLYGVNRGDWVIFAGVAIFLAAIAIAASYVPARRATQVDPMVALRNE